MQGGQKLADEAATFYERATTTLLKKSLLLHFAYADFEEVWVLFLIVCLRVQPLDFTPNYLYLRDEAKRNVFTRDP